MSVDVAFTAILALPATLTEVVAVQLFASVAVTE
ncbi:MAG: hypothetical protein ACI85O_000855 [Saprospiraceae bacterium]